MRLTCHDISERYDFGARHAEKWRQLSEDQMRDTLEAGAHLIIDEAREVILRKAKSHPRDHALEASIAVFSTHGPLYTRAHVGWLETPIPLTKATLQKKRPKGTGKHHKIRTVAGYGRLLEFDNNRQLTHMEDAYETKEEAAYDYVLKRMDELIDSALADIGL